MKEFRVVAIAAVAVGMLNVKNGARIESGWWNDEQKAREELEYFMEQRLPAGCYHVAIVIEERSAQ